MTPGHSALLTALVLAVGFALILWDYNRRDKAKRAQQARNLTEKIRRQRERVAREEAARLSGRGL